MDRELLFQQTALKNEILEHFIKGWDFCLLADTRNYVWISPGKGETTTYVEGLPIEDPKQPVPATLDDVLGLMNQYSDFRTMKPADNGNNQ